MTRPQLLFSDLCRMGRVGTSGGGASTRGSVSIEAVLIIPAFLLFLFLIAAIGRTADVRMDIHSATVQAARTAARETSYLAENAAQAAFTNHLAREGLTCQNLRIEIDVNALSLAPGQPGYITVSAQCTISLSDLAVPGLPGQITITDQYRTAINPYTER